MFKGTKGFTLIEMLVVVALIAILFTILLAQLGVSKRRSAAVAVKEGLSTFRITAQLQARNDPDGYAHVCELTTKAGADLLRVVRRVHPNAVDANELNCIADMDSFAVDANDLLTGLNLSETFCTDNIGYAKEGFADSADNTCSVNP